MSVLLRLLIALLLLIASSSDAQMGSGGFQPAPGGGGSGSGTVSSGTTNQIPKYTGATTVGDSTCADDGTTVTCTATGGIAATKFTSTGAASNSTFNGSINYCADAGSTDDYACTMSPALTAYATGTCYSFKANTANTGAATLNLNSLGSTAIKKVAGGVTTVLADNDIRAGQIVRVCYDGTNLQMQSTSGVAPGTGTASPAGSDGDLQVKSSTTLAAYAGSTACPGGVKTLSAAGAATCVSPSTAIYLYDEFMNSSITNGSIGALGWTCNQCSNFVVSNIVAGHPGVMTMATGGTGQAAGAISSMSLGSATAGSFDVAEMFDLTVHLRSTSADITTNQFMSVGISSTAADETPTSGFMIRQAVGAVALVGVLYNASAESGTANTSLGNLVASTWTTLRIFRVDSTTIGYQKDGGSVLCNTSAGSLPGGCSAGNISQTIPTGSMVPMINVWNNNQTVNKILQVDYAIWLVTGLSR